QINGQGPDIGDQYRSEIFYFNSDQKATIEKLILILKGKGYNVITKLTPATTFWKAEEYHQDYYQKENGIPYCHKFVEKF
ncbi:MAG: peptide-methionine (S)-S-oxide reductase, partial [Bacteroidetes bacterium]|nr:peptide-methionine (S)-S-oxide reductase [Bacteroidota bacterium]